MIDNSVVAPAGSPESDHVGFLEAQGENMRSLDVSWRPFALVTMAIIVGVWMGSRTGASPAQDQLSSRAQLAPQAREAANQPGIVVSAGITRGQTLRFDVFRFSSGNSVPLPLQLTVFDRMGNVVASAVLSNQNQNGAIVASFFDVNADQLAQSFFDNNGRAELIGLVSGIAGRGVPGGGDVVAGEVFDNMTGRTSVHILGKGTPGGGD